MKRRDFLKLIPSAAIVPAICTIGLSESIHTPSVKYGRSIINFGNIKIDGTFDEWIESIKVEVERILAPKNEGDIKYLVKIISCDWSGEKGSLPAKAIRIFNAGAHFSNTLSTIGARPITYFSFAKFEFERAELNKYSIRNLTNLVKVRFIDMLWGLEDNREMYFRLLRRFNPEHETSDDYLH